MPFHIDLVQRVKDDLERRGVSLSGSCGAFEITRRVAWLIQSEGWGLVKAPPGGEHCGGFRTDKLVNRSLSLFVDLLEDAGNKNGVAWQERPSTLDELGTWRAPVPVDDDGSSPVDPPAPPPAPLPGLPEFADEFLADIERLVGGVDSIASALQKQNEILIAIRDKGVTLRLR